MVLCLFLPSLLDIEHGSSPPKSTLVGIKLRYDPEGEIFLRAPYFDVTMALLWETFSLTTRAYRGRSTGSESGTPVLGDSFQHRRLLMTLSVPAFRLISRLERWLTFRFRDVLQQYMLR